MFGTTLAGRIESVFDALSGQLQRAARFVADHPAEVAMHSMRRVAERAGVAPVTMLRLARRLDLDDYETLRGMCRDLVRRRTEDSHFTDRAHALHSRRQSGSRNTLLADLLGAERENIERTLAAPGFAYLRAGARALLRAARRIFVVGRRSCYPVACCFFYAYRLFRPNAILIEDCAGSFGGDLLGIGAADVLLAVSFEPYSTETIAAVETARAAGARVVAVTDTALSPLGRPASVALIAANAGPAFLQSIVAATALAQALVIDLFLRAGGEAVAALATNEARLRAQGAYWTAESGRRKQRR
ncbi:MurR/RpiR family transcriptional regulator [Elioraea sp.]|uniref:MurR/RpiR family transcriptional regulator n=1 Tax=Elioraea sp. TaxID=2185103 RepID=UPI003F7143A5